MNEKNEKIENKNNFINSIFKKLLNKETILYLVFGVLTTIVDFVVYIVLTHFSVNYLLANVISWFFAVIFAYITNKHFVFESKDYDKDKIINESLDFVSSRIFSLAFNILFIYIVVTGFHANKLLTKAVAAVFVVIINYVLSKFFVFNDNEETDSLEDGVIMGFVKKNFAFFVSFLTPIIVMIILYKGREIYPFGDNMYLRSDCYHQYAPFMKEFLNKIVNGRSLEYSWNIGLGVNFSALYAYYLASPVNWILALTPAKYLVETMNILIILKTALCSLTFSIYLSHHYKTKKLSIATLSIFYALSSYYCAFSWNLMWLDCLLLLPIIVLGLERLVKENKCFLYSISLGIAIFSNYYIGIMLCIFCVIYYIFLLYMEDEQKTFSYLLIRFRNFAIYSLLAGGIAAITFLPAYYALSSTASSNFDFPKEMITYFSAMFMLSRTLINVDASIFTAHDPNLYCGVIVLLLVPMYVINPKIKFKDKVAKISIIAFMLFSFNTNIPNYIWHGFHYPNSLPARESFIYIFMVLCVSYEGLLYIRELTTKQIISCFAGVIALILFIEQWYVSDKYSSMSIYLSILFLILYMIVFSLFRNNNFKNIFISYLLILLLASEAYINADKTALGTCTRSAYLNDNDTITSFVNDISKKENENGNKFYRIEKENRRSKNDAAWSDYYGASTFSSTAKAGVSEFYGSLGFEESTNAYAYYGHTPLTEAMLSIKYVFNSSDLSDTKYRKKVDVKKYVNSYKKKSSLYLYENPYWLPLAYMMPEYIEETWDNSSSNPFANLNNLANAILSRSEASTPMYTRLAVETLASDNIITLDKDSHLYIYVTTSLDSINVSENQASGISTSKTHYNMKQQHILDLGYKKAGDIITVSSNEDSVSSIQLYAYSYDEEIGDEVYNALKESTINITSFKETDVKGNINVKKSGLLFTSIPYDDGWTVYVDGKKVKTHAFKDAMLSIYLSEGNHKIEFKYSSPGLKEGIIITILSVIAIVLLAFIEFKKSQREKLKKVNLE